MPDNAIGQSVRRKEDPRLLTGQGCYSDDFRFDDQLYGVVVRSPYAHARINGIDTAEALAMPGVRAVLTGADALADGLDRLTHRPQAPGNADPRLTAPDGSEPFQGRHLVLAADKARFVGEGVAFVVADTLAQARDAAEAVMVDFEPLPAVTVWRAALAPGAPLVWDEVPGNLVVETRFGDAEAADRAFDGAAHVVTLETHVNRVTGVTMEPRAALGTYDPESGVYTLYAGSGGSVRQRDEVSGALDVAKEKVRVIARDVGGNFGTRNPSYPEFGLVTWAARRLGRPVKWAADRGETFLSDYHGRDLYVRAELALDGDGHILGLRSHHVSNIGSHCVSFVPLSKGIGILTSVYEVPALAVRAQGVMTNTSPTNTYRSAGRPETIFVMERLMDLAAAETGIDPVTIRRINLIPPSAMPYTNRAGMTYDTGLFEKSMDMVLKLSDWEGFPARRAAAEAEGRRIGIGIANYVETASGRPDERAVVTILPDGVVEVVVGTLSSGQGHETAFAQLIVEWLGVPFDSLRLVTGDTKVVTIGGGSHSSRSMRLGGEVIVRAAERVRDKAKALAAQLLEAAEADIEFTSGKFAVKGTDRTVDLFTLAREADQDPALGAMLGGPLSAEITASSYTPTFPNGCHVCEVEVDADTGAYRILRYAAVDDVGRIINPLLVDGQVHGGIVQGLGQAIGEDIHYEAETGQNLSGSLMDYFMPHADDMPSFDLALNEVACTTNLLGVKGAGEGGTTPALAVLINALVDALADLGVRHIEMPATPQAVWRAIQAARAGR